MSMWKAPSEPSGGPQTDSERPEERRGFWSRLVGDSLARAPRGARERVGIRGVFMIDRHR
jgi:hypothetical protein